MSLAAAVAPSKKVQSYPENFKTGKNLVRKKERKYKKINLGNDRCPRCNDRVYYAEKVVANGINWHKV